MATALLVAGAFYPALGAGFALHDDWLIIAGALGEKAPSQLRGQGMTFDWYALVRADFTSLGRFRPGYWAIQCVEHTLFGASPRPWHWTSLLVLGAFSAAVYAALRRLDFPAPAAAAGVLASVLARPCGVWLSVSNAELWATGFLGASLYVGACAATAERRWLYDGFALSLAGLATLCKESFLLVIPALLVGRILLRTSPTAQARPRRLVILGLAYGATALALGGAAVAAVKTSGSASYGGITLASTHDLASTSVRAWEMAKISILDAGGLLPLWFLLAVTLVGNDRAPKGGECAAVASVAFLWVLPQIGLYSTRPAVWYYYYYPLCIGPALLNAWAIARVLRLRLAWLTVLVAVLSAVWLYQAWRTVSQEASREVAADAALDNLVHRAASSLPRDGILVLAGDFLDVLEPGARVLGGIGLTGRRDVTVGWLQTQQTTAFFDSTWRNTWLRSAVDWNATPADRLGALCVIRPTLDAFTRAEPLVRTLNMQRTDPSHSWSVWSWRQRAWTTRVESYACWFR